MTSNKCSCPFFVIYDIKYMKMFFKDFYGIGTSRRLGLFYFIACLLKISLFFISLYLSLHISYIFCIYLFFIWHAFKILKNSTKLNIFFFFTSGFWTFQQLYFVFSLLFLTEVLCSKIKVINGNPASNPIVTSNEICFLFLSIFFAIWSKNFQCICSSFYICKLFFINAWMRMHWSC